MAITITERPPLELHAEVEAPDGTTVKLHSGAAKPGDRPQNIGFRTARMDGFKDGSCTLARRIDQPQDDIALFNLLRFIGATGDIAYEGRIAGRPRSTGTPPTWTIQAAGLMANARDRKFAMPFIDRDPSRWEEPDLARRQALAGTFDTNLITATADKAQLTFAVPGGQSIPSQALCERYYRPPTGVTLDKFAYKASESGDFTGFEARTLFPNGATSIVLTIDNAVHTATFSAAADQLMTRVYRGSGVAATQPAGGTVLIFSKSGVYGSHGLTTYPIDSELDGVLASDVITWLIENYCPLLNANGVQQTTYAIGHLAFMDRTHPYDAFLTANSYHRWGLECWEGGTVHYQPLDLTDYDWELRLDDFGTALDVNGEVAEEVANGIEVTYTNVSTGSTSTLLPDDHDELRDTNPLNPVNRAGLYRPMDYTVSSPVLEDMALQIGRAALAEFNRPKHKGTATREGYVKDRAGNWQPAWKVRAGDRVLITDSVDEEIHVVYETDYSQSPRPQVRIAVDDTFSQLDAYLDRYANATQAAGL